MQLPICAVIAWVAIIVFTLVPKRLLCLDIVFLYCVVLILTTTSYTFFELNLHSVTVPRLATALTAAAICRLITIPLFIVMAVNALQRFHEKSPRWLISTAIWLGLTAFDWVLSRFNVITYHRSLVWHAVGTPITYLAYIAIPWGLTLWYRRFDLGRVKTT